MRTWMLSTTLLLTIAILPSSALQPHGNVGQIMLTGGADVIMKGEEFGELVALTLLHALLCDESGDSNCHGDDPYYHDDDYVESEIEVLVAQFGTGLGYFMSPGLVLGGRVMLQAGGAYPQEGTIAGIGPELTYFIKSHGTWIPFVGASALYTRGFSSARDGETSSSGNSILLRSGLYAQASSAGGFYLQFSFQQNRMETLYGEPRGDQRFGVGLGFTAAFD
jgi:hypothetical protein